MSLVVSRERRKIARILDSFFVASNGLTTDHPRTGEGASNKRRLGSLEIER